jgi:hypothetical protein
VRIEDGHGSNLIAGILNRDGLKSGNGSRWSRERVTSTRSNYVRQLAFNSF